MLDQAQSDRAHLAFWVAINLFERGHLACRAHVLYKHRAHNHLQTAKVAQLPRLPMPMTWSVNVHTLQFHLQDGSWHVSVGGTLLREQNIYCYSVLGSSWFAVIE